MAVSEADIRSAGLSRGKVLALRDMAQRSPAGEVPTLAEARGMEDEAVITRLTRVRGIGRRTPQMLLIFHLGRPDVLPIEAYDLRRGFALAFGTEHLPTPAEVRDRGWLWRPYRSLASWYLWRAAEGPAPAGPRAVGSCGAEPPQGQSHLEI